VLAGVVWCDRRVRFGPKVPASSGKPAGLAIGRLAAGPLFAGLAVILGLLILSQGSSGSRACAARHSSRYLSCLDAGLQAVKRAVEIAKVSEKLLERIAGGRRTRSWKWGNFVRLRRRSAISVIVDDAHN
jgi:hypothetical protein